MTGKTTIEWTDQPGRFQAYRVGPFYVSTFRHTGSYPLIERAMTVEVAGGPIFGHGWALCLPFYHDTKHRAHRALVVGVTR